MQKRVLALLLAFTLVLMPNTVAFADYDGLEYLPTYETLADDDVTYEVIDSTVDSYVPVATIDETAVLFGEETDADLPPNSAMFGTPTLGTHDPIWETTVPLPIERSTLPAADARRGVTTGVGFGVVLFVLRNISLTIFSTIFTKSFVPCEVRAVFCFSIRALNTSIILQEM